MSRSPQRPSSIIPRQKKSVSCTPYYSSYSPVLPRSVTQVSKKALNRQFLFSLLEEQQVTDFDELLERAELMSEEHQLQLLVLILKKDAEERNANEINFLEKKMQIFDFFRQIRQKIPFESYLELFKELKFESHQKLSTIFLYGDVGKKLFVILKGSVFVLVPKIKVNKSDDVLIRKFDNLSNNMRRSETFIYEDESLKENSNHETAFLDEQNDEQKILEKYPNFRIVNVLKKGSLFGEISLTLKEPRTATIVCKEDSSFCTLKSGAFERILKTNYDKELDFLQNIALFKGMSLQNIAIIKGYLSEILFQKDYLIFRPGSEAKEIYIVKEGEVEIYKSIEIAQTNMEPETSLGLTLINSVKEKILNLKRSTSHIRNITVGQSFGEEDIFLKQNRSSFAIVSSSKARILSLKKEDFFENLKSLKVLKNIEQAFTFKIRWQQNKIQRVVRTKSENELNLKGLSHRQKSQLIHDEMGTEEGKKQLLKKLTLRSVRGRENSLQIKSNKIKIDEIDQYSDFKSKINVTKNKHPSFLPLNLSSVPRELEHVQSERKSHKKGELNIQISPILKMCACSQLSKSKKRGSVPNIKGLVQMQNYEEELKKQIIFKICKANRAIETRVMKGYVSKMRPAEGNEGNVSKIMNSLRMSEEVRQKFLKRNESRGFE